MSLIDIVPLEQLGGLKMRGAPRRKSCANSPLKYIQPFNRGK